MTRKHKLDEVLKSLTKKNDVQVKGINILILTDTVYNAKLDKVIPNSKKKHDLGNGSLGRIDFLVNHCGYIKSYVAEFKTTKHK